MHNLILHTRRAHLQIHWHAPQEPIPTSLLKMNADHMGRATKMFAGMLKYMGEAGDAAEPAAGIEIAQKLLHQGLKRPELKDELYMQLLKQTRGNPNVPSRIKAWELFQLTAATMPPSKVKPGTDRVNLRTHTHTHTHAHTHTHSNTYTRTYACAWAHALSLTHTFIGNK